CTNRPVLGFYYIDYW
nr:immunoglobulin heavy chain junction region [Macaca mulatta]